MRTLGRHLIAEYTDCKPGLLNDADFLERCLLEAVRRSGATIVKSIFHRYAPQGVSGVIVIAESHMSIHTWPEYNYAAVDFFTCGQSVDPYLANEYLKEALGSPNASVTEVARGIPSSSDEVLQHKPVSATSIRLSRGRSTPTRRAMRGGVPSFSWRFRVVSHPGEPGPGLQTGGDTDPEVGERTRLMSY